MSTIESPVSSITDVMILAAGMGNRLRPLTLTTPKPLMTIKNISFLERVLNFIKENAPYIENIVVNTHYLSSHIHEFICSKEQHISPTSIQISHETDLLETGGAIANALPLFKKTPIFTINGDIWWQEDCQEQEKNIFQTLLEAWDPEKMDALLLLVPREKALFYEGNGDFIRQDNGQLIGRNPEEKGNTKEFPYVYMGIQLIHPRLLEGRKGKFSLPECYRSAISKGRLYGVPFKGQWCDAGTIHAFTCLTTYFHEHNLI